MWARTQLLSGKFIGEGHTGSRGRSGSRVVSVCCPNEPVQTLDASEASAVWNRYSAVGSTSSSPDCCERITAENVSVA